MAQPHDHLAQQAAREYADQTEKRRIEFEAEQERKRQAFEERLAGC